MHCLQSVSQPKAPAALPAASLLNDIQSDFMIASGLSTTGTPLAAASIADAKQKMDEAYVTSEMAPDVSCFGGDIAQKCGSQAWLDSVASQSAFLTYLSAQTLPISALTSDTALDLEQSLPAAVSAVQSSMQTAWTAGAFCPACGAGASCSGAGVNVCNCPVVSCEYVGGECNAFGRLCDKCVAGWGSTNCAAPQCNPGCNLGHSSCTNVNVCTCRDGYSGSTCFNPPHSDDDDFW